MYVGFKRQTTLCHRTFDSALVLVFNLLRDAEYDCSRRQPRSKLQHIPFLVAEVRAFKDRDTHKWQCASHFFLICTGQILDGADY